MARRSGIIIIITIGRNAARRCVLCLKNTYTYTGAGGCAWTPRTRDGGSFVTCVACSLPETLPQAYRTVSGKALTCTKCPQDEREHAAVPSAASVAASLVTPSRDREACAILKAMMQTDTRLHPWDRCKNAVVGYLTACFLYQQMQGFVRKRIYALVHE